MVKRSVLTPAQLTCVYIIVALVWIVGSDLALVAWQGGAMTMALRNSAKGALFVLVSGGLLWALTRQMVRRNDEVTRALLDERSKAAVILQRKERMQATLARANQAALQLEDPDRLCAEICSALVENTGLQLAWIGWEDAATRRIQPAQRCGPASADFDDVWCSADPSDGGHNGPTGIAVTENRTIVSQDIARDASLRHWRERALARGLRSCAAVPIGAGSGPRGALTVYAGETSFFDAESIAMLEQLATDLRQGLEVLAVRREMKCQTEALRRSEERWQFALDTAGDGVWDWNIETGEVFYSARLAQILGFAPGELRGRVEAWEHRIHPEDRPRVVATLQRCLSGESSECVCEYRLRAKDGNYRWILGRGRVVGSENGQRSARMIGTHTDITARRETEQQLYLVQAALQAAPVGVLITDRSGAIEWVNAAFGTITGHAPEKILGKNPRVLKSDHHDADFFAALWTTILRGETWNGELTNRRPDGTDYPVTMTIAPVRDETGAIAHFVAVMQDVTERRQLEEQFLRAQRLESVGQLASGIAHDLNNVLAPILLTVEMLKLKTADPVSLSSLAMIDSAARRGARIIRQVLTFARGVDGERTPLQPRDIVCELASILGQTLPRHIRIERDVSDDLPFIEGDATQMHQMLMNLAINARDAMELGGTLRLAASVESISSARLTVAGVMPPGTYVVLRVSDTGPGIPPDAMARIFEPFFTTKPKGKGTGLGLATTLGIVRSHRGFIEVTTSPRGTAFIIFLPAIPPTETPSEPAIVKDQLRGDGRLLLVCDDEPSIRELTVAIFVSHGFRVVVAENGAESITLFRQHRDELAGVVLDLMMPGYTGTEVLAHIRREHPRLPVLLASGLMSEAISAEELARETARGPTGTIQKPYTAPALLDALDRLFERAAKTET